jgi:hypothetical protein
MAAGTPLLLLPVRQLVEVHSTRTPHHTHCGGLHTVMHINRHCMQHHTDTPSSAPTAATRAQALRRTASSARRSARSGWLRARLTALGCQSRWGDGLVGAWRWRGGDCG